MTFAAAPAYRRGLGYAIEGSPPAPKRRGTPSRPGDDLDADRTRRPSAFVHAIRAWLGRPRVADADKGRDTRTERR